MDIILTAGRYLFSVCTFPRLWFPLLSVFPGGLLFGVITNRPAPPLDSFSLRSFARRVWRCVFCFSFFSISACPNVSQRKSPLFCYKAPASVAGCILTLLRGSEGDWGGGNRVFELTYRNIVDRWVGWPAWWCRKPGGDHCTRAASETQHMFATIIAGIFSRDVILFLLK